MTQKEVVGLGTYEIVYADADDSENLKIAIGLKHVSRFDFWRSYSKQMNHEHHQASMGNPEFAEIVVGESFEQCGGDNGVEGENPNKEIHHIPHPGFLFIAIGQGRKGEPITGV